MTSKIVVNNIEADAGVSTVTFNSNIVRGGSNLHSTGLALGAGSTVGAVTGVTTYYGDGSQLTGITQTTINNNADNRVITGSGTANRLNGESGFTFDGTDVQVPDKILLNTSGSSIKSNQLRFQSGGAAYIDQYNTSQSINIRMSSSSALDTTAMTINHNGHMTKPSQPGFGASQMNGWTTITGSTYAVTSYNIVHHNYGSHFNSSNGRFTAPVDGRYFFHAIGMGVQNTAPHIAFGINNSSNGGGPSRGGTNYGNNNMWSHPSSSYYWVTITHILDLSANDYVRVYTYDWNSSADAVRTYFYGYLLG